MTMQRPGLPGDLPAPEVLWARWALVAVVEATTAAESARYRTGTWIDEEGLHLDDCGCTWWTFSRVADGRYVLFGEDESSGVKWHRPPVDMLAGAPDWLPHEELRDRLEGDELGCVYWYENGAWARAPYPDDLGDDGLDCGMSRFVVRAEALRLLDEHVRRDGGSSAAALLEHAEDRRLTQELLESLVAPADGSAPDLPAMTRALHRAGLAPRTAAAG
ncbi:hypothetical protein M5362_13280 [Streptomyces sp. Je 1-79]|uniref:hypothetical protein n=1 Tax=Streptomyces sp. Je 1-79 TaxID=2943847 RepID=UPI0021A42709|nr:hypothetical protein [Streptomyces sp. Je 1-79]MCT4354104.1 hypothetical protein [Streptomyces sp. Je 1-79]